MHNIEFNISCNEVIADMLIDAVQKLAEDNYDNCNYDDLILMLSSLIRQKAEQTKEKSEPNPIPENGIDVSKFDAVAYIDGSYNDETKISGGGGFVRIRFGKEIHYIVFSDNPDIIETRNVGGELLSCLSAIKIAAIHNCKNIVIFHDYEGIGAWITDDRVTDAQYKIWKAKLPVSKAYVEMMKSFDIEPYFVKVKAHHGNKGNEYADYLAKIAAIGNKHNPDYPTGMFIDEETQKAFISHIEQNK